MTEAATAQHHKPKEAAVPKVAKTVGVFAKRLQATGSASEK
jgi:hypothetical protein